MKLQFALVLLLFYATSYSLPRQIQLHPVPDKFFSDSAYQALIKKQYRTLSAENNIPGARFEENYESLEDTILGYTLPELSINFEVLSKSIRAGNRNPQITTQLFEKEIGRSVRKLYKRFPFIGKALSKSNLNDRIVSFDSKIQIEKNGNIHVRETIIIANSNSESGEYNNQIKRGITREFPTSYHTKFGLISTVPFHLKSISRNGKPESYHTEKLSNGIRIYCGQSNYYLEEGIHRYEIEYQTAYQLIFHPQKDELYWNVTGNGWNFSIGKASCSIKFPDGARIMENDCYTGRQGEKGKSCQYTQIDSGTILFKSNKSLQQNEGLTVAVSIQKGIVAAPSLPEQILKWVKDNRFLSILFASVAILFTILFRYWLKVGRDPKPGLIIPEFAPPAELSPAEVGYIYQQKYSQKLLTASLIDLAVRRKLQIEVDREGLIFKSNVYKFLAPVVDENSANDSNSFFQTHGIEPDTLFGMEIKGGTYNPLFTSICTKFKSHLEGKILKDNPQKNAKGLLSLNNSHIGIGILFLFFLMMGIIIYCSIFRPPLPTILVAVGIFFTGVVIQIVFMNIIKALTPEGRKLADRIQGFKMYLETTEKNIFNDLNPPEENLQLFEKYLPFAIALGVENQWSLHFKDIIEKALATGYSPTYYVVNSHSNFSQNFNSFASDIGSGLSNTVSSASSPPSSSSSGGSSGGGSSGGGGGGGGGGGW